MRQLLSMRNTHHGTIEALDSAIGYNGMMRALITAAERRGRLPSAQKINAIADELDGVTPVEVLFAFARDAGVDMPESMGATEIWLRIIELPDPKRKAIAEILTILVDQLVEDVEP